MTNRFYIDCEFDGHNGPLLSMAVIREDGRGLYLCLADAPRELTPWVAENVWPLVHMKLPIGKTYSYVNDWGDLIGRFMRCSHPVVIADSPQDARYFSEVTVTAPDGGYAPFPFDGLTFEIHNVDPYPTELPATQHNAYWDAVALRHKLTQRIEARQGGNGEAGAVHESPVGVADAPEPQSDTPS